MRLACIASGTSALLLVASATTAQASPIEVPIDTSNSTGFVSLVYGSFTKNATLSLGTEVDGYTFGGAAGDRISLITATTNANLLPSVVLRDPFGAVISTAACTGHSVSGTCAVDMQKQLPSTGLYTLNVSDVGANNAGAYTLHLDRYPPISNWLGFGYGAPSPYGIDHLGDSDYFAFNVNSGSQFRLTVATQSPLNTHIEVWDTSGSLIRSVACTGFTTSGSCTLLLDLSASANGYYKVGIHDVGWDSIGTYQIGVTCLFGNCATGVPVAPVPELPSVWLLSLGTAALGWRRFRRGRA